VVLSWGEETTRVTREGGLGSSPVRSAHSTFSEPKDVTIKHDVVGLYASHLGKRLQAAEEALLRQMCDVGRGGSLDA
jgi:hypothetical protein